MVEYMYFLSTYNFFITLVLYTTVYKIRYLRSVCLSVWDMRWKHDMKNMYRHLSTAKSLRQTWVVRYQTGHPFFTRWVVYPLHHSDSYNNIHTYSNTFSDALWKMLENNMDILVWIAAFCTFQVSQSWSVVLCLPGVIYQYYKPWRNICNSNLVSFCFCAVYKNMCWISRTVFCIFSRSDILWVGIKTPLVLAYFHLSRSAEHSNFAYIRIHMVMIPYNQQAAWNRMGGTPRTTP